MTVDGPAAGHDALQDQSRPERAQAVGHDQQLRRRPHALGHLSDRARRTATATSGPTARAPTASGSTRASADAQQRSYERYGIPSNWYSWGRFHDRFNVDKEANECNRFNWIVEIDPVRPEFAAREAHRARPLPARGRGDGRQQGRPGGGLFGRRFTLRVRLPLRLASNRYRPGNKAHNMRLLSEGTLSVARFDADGSLDLAAARVRQGSAHARERVPTRRPMC